MATELIQQIADLLAARRGKEAAQRQRESERRKQQAEVEAALSKLTEAVLLPTLNEVAVAMTVLGISSYVEVPSRFVAQITFLNLSGQASKTTFTWRGDPARQVVVAEAGEEGAPTLEPLGSYPIGKLDAEKVRAAVLGFVEGQLGPSGD